MGGALSETAATSWCRNQDQIRPSPCGRRASAPTENGLSTDSHSSVGVFVERQSIRSSIMMSVEVPMNDDDWWADGTLQTEEV